MQPLDWFSRLIIAKCRPLVLQNAQREHSAIISTCIKLPSVFKTFVFPTFEWPLKDIFNCILMGEALAVVFMDQCTRCWLLSYQRAAKAHGSLARAFVARMRNVWMQTKGSGKSIDL